MAKRKHEKRNRDKNIILFLVEGNSEINALKNPVSALYHLVSPEYRIIFAKPYRVCKGNLNSPSCLESQPDVEDQEETEKDMIPEVFYIPAGDVTSASYVTPDNIETKIYNRFFKPIMSEKKIYPSMLLEVVQIVDLDGTYLDDTQVVSYFREHQSSEHVFYNTEDQCIECREPQMIQERNKRKCMNIDYLVHLESIKMGNKVVPYSVYYFSSNLDHYLHHDANIERGKEALAKNFSESFAEDLPGFVEFFFDESCTPIGQTYLSSWEAVKQNNLSISRGSNLNILIEKIINAGR